MANSAGKQCPEDAGSIPFIFDHGQPSRLPFAGGGRAHVDRLLPFVMLNRAGEADQAAQAGVVIRLR